MTAKTLEQPESSAQLAQKFRLATQRFAELALVESVTVTPFRDASLPHFSKLNYKKQLSVLGYLNQQLSLFEVAAEEGLSLRSTQAVWRALHKMGLTPTSDIFDKIEEGDTLEVYQSDGTSFFKNLRFFEFISMSLEELYCLHWLDLLGLSGEGYLFFMEVNLRLKLGLIKRTFRPTFSNYILTEKRGEGRSFRIDLKWISPLTVSGQKNAVLVVNRSAFAAN